MADTSSGILQEETGVKDIREYSSTKFAVLAADKEMGKRAWILTPDQTGKTSRLLDQTGMAGSRKGRYLLSRDIFKTAS
jgi:hypothetical protein